MAGKKGPVDPLKAKEAKQKKIAIGGAVLLLIVLVVQVPKLMKQMGHSTAPPPVPASTTSAAATTPSPSGTPSAPAAAAPTSPTGTGSLLAENAPTAAIGQLSSFGSFASKDPFAAPTPAGGTGVPPAKSGGKKTQTTPPKPPTPPTPPSTPSTPTTAPLTSAVISVNGLRMQVAVGDDFPASQPFFHLVSVSAHSAKISIAGGSLANGAPSLTLQEGKPLTLMNTTDGTRYKLVLLPQGTPVTTTTTSGGAGAGGSSGSGTGSTTGTTTGTTGGTTTGP